MKSFRKQKKAWLWVLLVLGIVVVSIYYSQHTQVSETSAELSLQEVEVKKEKESEEHYPILHVFDGDTFTVRMPDGSVESVRLIGIDAPETGKKYTKRECFGEEATDALVALISGSSVRLKADPSQDDRDVHGRLLRYATLADGTDVGLRMIESGFAREYTFRGREYQHQADYREADMHVREKKVGIWRACETK